MFLLTWIPCRVVVAALALVATAAAVVFEVTQGRNEEPAEQTSLTAVGAVRNVVGIS